MIDNTGNSAVNSIILTHNEKIYKVESNEIKSNGLLVDTGASSHILCSDTYFQDFDKTFEPAATFLELADGSKHNNLIQGRGTASIPLYDVTGRQRMVILYNALYVPSFTRNILSLFEAVRAGIQFYLNNPGQEYMCTPDGNKFNITTAGRLYIVNTVSCSTVISHTAKMWHKILGHCHIQDVLKLPGVVKNMKITDKSFSNCNICNLAKMKVDMNKTRETRSEIPFESIHIDLHGPLNESDDYRYTFGAVDEFSGYLAVYLMKCKSDATQAMKQFIADHTIYGTIKKIRTDGGGEFKSHAFKEIMLENRIRHESSCPHSPHQLGLIERIWQTIFNMTRAILFESNVPAHLWPYIVKSAAYIRNRCFNNRLNKTPLEAATGRKPNLASLHLFGCKCYAYNTGHKGKLQPRSKASVFIGYDDHSPSYIVYDPVDGKISKVRCVRFTTELYYGQTPSASAPRPAPNTGSNSCPPGTPMVEPPDPIVESPPSDTEESNTESTQTHYEARSRKYPIRNRIKTNRFGVENSEYNEQTLDDMEFVSTLNHCSNIITVPQNYKEAISSADKNTWIRAMADEIAALQANNTYELVVLPPGVKPVGGRWTFRVKQEPSGTFLFKARWVACGFSQKYGIDYDETFAPTARVTSVRIIIQITIQFKLIVEQLDVNNAYLNSEIDRPIYMVQPEGFVTNPNLVCKLNKSLYGLKQSARLWNSTIDKFLKSENLTPSQNDPCVYYKITNKVMMYVLIWVDDIIVAANNRSVLNNFKEKLNNRFRVKSMGPLNWFLGIQFKISDSVISMNQSMYINNILTRFSMTDCAPKTLPCDPSIHSVLKNKSKLMKNPTLYRELVGSLIYLMYCTRPDITFVVNILSQFMSAPMDIHMNIAKGVLKYLKYTMNYELKYVPDTNKLRVIGYSDSDFASSADRRSISGYCFQLNSNSALISWKTKKQTLVADSTCECEYVALSEATKEANFLRQYFAELTQAPREPVTIYVDNQSSIALAHHHAFHKRSKHIDTKYHFVRCYIEHEFIKIKYIPTADNIADIFTKAVNGQRLLNFACMRGTILNAEGGDVEVHDNICNLCIMLPQFSHLRLQNCK